MKTELLINSSLVVFQAVYNKKQLLSAATVMTIIHIPPPYNSWRDEILNIKRAGAPGKD